MQLILKRCSKPGCLEHIPRSQKPPYCTAHQRQRNRIYDRTREPQIVAFYHSSKWRKLRASVLAEAFHLCESCKEQGELTPADTVHHLVELKEDWALRLTRENLIAICRTCHEKVHDRFS